MFADLALAQYSGVFDVADRAQVRTFDTVDSPRPTVDVVNNPSARLQLGTRSWQHTASYFPSLTLRDPQPKRNPELFHAVSLGTAWHGTRTRFSLGEEIRYGDRIFLGDIAPGQQVPLRFVGSV